MFLSTFASSVLGLQVYDTNPGFILYFGWNPGLCVFWASISATHFLSLLFLIPLLLLFGWFLENHKDPPVLNFLH